MSAVLLSVIIVTYGQRELVEACISSIYQYNDIGEGLEIVISDNSPDDAVVRMVRAKYPGVLIVKNDNIGFGAGNNAGIRLATGDLLFLLNPDTLLVEPVFHKALSVFQDDASLGMMGVSLLDAHNRRLVSYEWRPECCVLPAFFMNLATKFMNHIHLFCEAMFPYGAALFVRKRAFLEAGQFDENLFMYYEEADIQNRLLDHGYHVKHCSDIHIIHLIGRSSQNKSRQVQIQLQSLKYYANKYRFGYKHIAKGQRNVLKMKQILRKEKNENAIRVYDAFLSNNDNGSIE